MGNYICNNPGSIIRTKYSTDHTISITVMFCACSYTYCLQQAKEETEWQKHEWLSDSWKWNNPPQQTMETYDVILKAVFYILQNLTAKKNMCNKLLRIPKINIEYHEVLQTISQKLTAELCCTFQLKSYDLKICMTGNFIGEYKGFRLQYWSFVFRLKNQYFF